VLIDRVACHPECGSVAAFRCQAGLSHLDGRLGMAGKGQGEAASG
jgi:hypothetical protein